MVMLDWPDVNVREPEQVKERMGMYFALCAQDDMKPSVAGMALAFGVTERRYGHGQMGWIVRRYPPKAVT